MALKISTAARQGAGDAVVDLVDGGTGAGVINIYSGTAPTSVNDALSGNTLLAALTMSDPAFGATNTSGVATASAITADTSANADGTATFFRVADSNGNAVMQGTVGTSGADLNLNSTSISTSIEVSITSMTVTVPESA